jgi:hypothetical protein
VTVIATMYNIANALSRTPELTLRCSDSQRGVNLREHDFSNREGAM